MDLKLLKQVLEYDLLDEVKENLILQVLAKDKEVIPNLLKMLDCEREFNQDLLLDINEELSKTYMTLKMSKDKNKTFLEQKTFILGSVKKFYEKYKEVIVCNFNI